FVEIREGATLTVGEDTNGEIAVAASRVALDGRLNLDLANDTEAGDLGSFVIEGAGSIHLIGDAIVLVDDASGLQYAGGTFVEGGKLLMTDAFDGDITTSGEGVFELYDGADFTGDLI